MKNINRAKELGKWMKKVGKEFNVKTDIVYSNMNQPLGRYAGLSCEVFEAIECLKGKGKEDIMDVTYELGSKLLFQSGITKSKSESIKLQSDLINSGRALKIFENSVEMQGGKLDEFLYQKAEKYENYLYPKHSGFIQDINTESIGWHLVELGCVLQNSKGILDKSAGIEFLFKIGDKIHRDQPIFRVFGSTKDKINKVSKGLKSTITISDEESNIESTIL